MRLPTRIRLPAHPPESLSPCRPQPRHTPRPQPLRYPRLTRPPPPPVWLEEGRESECATRPIARIRAADADGFDLTGYKIPVFAAAGADALAEAELKFSETLFT